MKKKYGKKEGAVGASAEGAAALLRVYTINCGRSDSRYDGFGAEILEIGWREKGSFLRRGTKITFVPCEPVHPRLTADKKDGRRRNKFTRRLEETGATAYIAEL